MKVTKIRLAALLFSWLQGLYRIAFQVDLKSILSNIKLCYTSPTHFQGRRGAASVRAETVPKSIRGPIRYEVCSGYRLQCTRQSFKLSKEKPSNRLARVAPVNQLNSLSLSLRICENMRRACRQNESKCDQLQHISNKTKALLWDLELVT